MKRVLTILLLALTPLVHAQSLWGQSIFGMSVPELREAYPEAIEIDHEPTRRSGTSDYWQLKEVIVAGEPFTASFLFREHRLDTVMLYPEKQDSTKIPVLESTIRAALNQKYGDISEHTELKGAFVRASAWTWVKDGTTITLEIINGPTRPMSLHVRYDTKVAKTAENL